MMSDLGHASRAAIDRVNAIVGPLQQLSNALRRLPRLKLSPEDERAVVAAIEGLAHDLALIAQNTEPVIELAATLRGLT